MASEAMIGMKRPSLPGFAVAAILVASAIALVSFVRDWGPSSAGPLSEGESSVLGSKVERPGGEESERPGASGPSEGMGEGTEAVRSASEEPRGEVRPDANPPPDKERALREALDHYGFLLEYGNSAAEGYSRSSVVETIREIGTRQAFLALQEISITDPLAAVRSAALGEMVWWMDTERDAIIEGLLNALLHDESEMVQATAAANIGSITPRFHRLYPDVVEALLAATSREYDYLSIFAFKQLRFCLDPPEYRQLISSRLEVEERPKVREALLEIQQKLDGKEKR